MNQPQDWNGRVLNTALQEQPSLILSFYSFNVLLECVKTIEPQSSRITQILFHRL